MYIHIYNVQFFMCIYIFIHFCEYRLLKETSESTPLGCGKDLQAKTDQQRKLTFVRAKKYVFARGKKICFSSFQATALK